jgi:hypothetical protein
MWRTALSASDEDKDSLSGECADDEHCPTPTRGNPYVTGADCNLKHVKLDLALFGVDGRGGIVKDLQEIKTATSAVRSIIVPVTVSVVSALITAYALLRL